MNERTLKILNAFYESRATEGRNGKKSNTVPVYRSAIQRFLLACGKEDITHVTPSDVETFTNEKIKKVYINGILLYMYCNDSEGCKVQLTQEMILHLLPSEYKKLLEV